MQNSNHNNMEDKFGMNFANFDADSLFNSAHMGGLHLGMKRSANDAGLDREAMGLTSDEDELVKKEDNWPWDSGKDPKAAVQSKSKEESKMHATSTSRENVIHHHHQTNLEEEPQHAPQQKTVLPNGKKTKGRVKIKMEFIDNKLRRYTTFSKRKTGIMKKAYELSTLTGTQVMLLVASETGHVYTFATRKLQPMITSDAGKALIQTCLNSPDPTPSSSSGGSHPSHHDQRMSATGYEETELTYAVAEEEHKSPSGGTEEYLNGSSYSGSDSSSPPTPSLSPAHTPNFSFSTPSLTSNPSTVISSASGAPGISSAALPVHLGPGLVLTPSVADVGETNSSEEPHPVSTAVSATVVPVQSRPTTTTSVLKPSNNLTTLTIIKSPSFSGGSMVVGNPGGSLMYSPSGNVVYAPSPTSLPEGSTPLLLNLPHGLQLTSEQGSGNPQLVTLPMNLASAAALQQSAAVAAAVSAASAAVSASSSPSESLPTDLSLHIKRENRS